MYKKARICEFYKVILRKGVYHSSERGKKGLILVEKREKVNLDEFLNDLDRVLKLYKKDEEKFSKELDKVISSISDNKVEEDDLIYKLEELEHFFMKNLVLNNLEINKINKKEKKLIKELNKKIIDIPIV